MRISRVATTSTEPPTAPPRPGGRLAGRDGRVGGAAATGGRTLSGGAARLLCAGALALAFAAGAPAAEDPAMKARLKKLESELRCLVCQNQTLADSDADLARDLRDEVRKLAESGRSDDEIKSYLVARYGDFVLYRPPVKSTTWLLWAGPFALLALGAGIWVVILRRRGAARGAPAAQALTDEQRALAKRLLEGEGRGGAG